MDEALKIAVEALQVAKSAHHRVDEIRKTTGAIERMGISMEQIAQSVKEMLELLKNHDERLVVLEKKPGVLALSAWKFVGAIAATAAVSAVLTKLFG